MSSWRVIKVLSGYSISPACNKEKKSHWIHMCLGQLFWHLALTYFSWAFRDTKSLKRERRRSFAARNTETGVYWLIERYMIFRTLLISRLADFYLSCLSWGLENFVIWRLVLRVFSTSPIHKSLLIYDQVRTESVCHAQVSGNMIPWRFKSWS